MPKKYNDDTYVYFTRFNRIGFTGYFTIILLCVCTEIEGLRTTVGLTQNNWIFDGRSSGDGQEAQND